jgi:hypothetical protein
MASPGFFSGNALGPRPVQRSFEPVPDWLKFARESADELKPCFTHEGALRFPADQPFAGRSPRKIVKARVVENRRVGLS